MQKTAYEVRISDCSSDVCSSDLALLVLKEGQRHYRATYELCSEGRFTAYDIGETSGRVTGQSSSVQEISADDYLTVLFGDGDRSQFAHQVAVLKSISKIGRAHV